MKLPAGLIQPDYAGGSLLNLALSIATHFGVQTGHPGLRNDLPIEGVDTIVMFVIDGLGQGQLEKYIADGDAPTLKSLLEVGQHQTLTSVFPSTTMAAMTAMYTGCAQAESGWLGFILWLEDRDFLCVVPNLASRFEKAGVNCFAVQPSEYRGTWLDEWYWHRAIRSGYITTNTLPSVAVNALEVSDMQVRDGLLPGLRHGVSSARPFKRSCLRRDQCHRSRAQTAAKTDSA